MMWEDWCSQRMHGGSFLFLSDIQDRLLCFNMVELFINNVTRREAILEHSGNNIDSNKLEKNLLLISISLKCNLESSSLSLLFNNLSIYIRITEIPN